jgi:hypothetical protein
MSAPVMALVANGKMLPHQFGQCDVADPRYQQYQSLSFHPDGPEFAPRFRLRICMSTICALRMDERKRSGRLAVPAPIPDFTMNVNSKD